MNVVTSTSYELHHATGETSTSAMMHKLLLKIAFMIAMIALNGRGTNNTPFAIESKVLCNQLREIGDPFEVAILFTAFCNSCPIGQHTVQATK
jgi:hypothetical protein